MSNVISDGVIITKDGTKQYGIGINQDNTAFMSEFTLYSVLEKSDGTKTNIYNINKYRQPYSIYMMTDIFSNETHNNTDGIDVILGSVEGEMKIGKKITATVESVDEYAGSIAIPKGKIILTVDKNAPEEFYNPVASLEIGEQITISFGVEGDERWKNAKAGIGATGGMLLKDGTVNPSLDAGANPRTALGIKSDGSLLMYTIDGRQSGYSYGVQLKTLANRLKELGCTDAINLDGGGSTTFVAQFPGDDYMSLINRPSDGSQRAVANFIFLKNNLPKTGILNKITIYPLTSYILKGASLQFSAKGSDTSYYPADTPNLQYYVQSEKESTVDSNGIFTAKDSGIVTLYASSNQVTGSTNVNCIETPTSIDILNESNGKNVSEITIMRNSSINLTASAYAGYNKVTANDGCFNWSCDENIGTIDQNGNFTANNVIFAKGNIYVNAGEKTTAIPVSVTANGKETDEELQTLISIDTSAENTLISFKSNFGLKVNKDDIIIRADGEDIDFEYNSDKETASVVIPYEKTKLTVFATNSLGKTSFKTISVSESDYKNPFIDTKNHWAENILSYMYKNKIINGENTLEGTKFNPNKSMTRAEFAVMITNYLKIDISKYNNVE
ncbi:MAG: phosphodiester glycosidase family protein, partial [Clostridia bacterium]|nr:phosphodiester glycosidase family protein [Clostridia bacterium]